MNEQALQDAEEALRAAQKAYAEARPFYLLCEVLEKYNIQPHQIKQMEKASGVPFPSWRAFNVPSKYGYTQERGLPKADVDAWFRVSRSTIAGLAEDNASVLKLSAKTRGVLVRLWGRLGVKTSEVPITARAVSALMRGELGALVRGSGRKAETEIMEWLSQNQMYLQDEGIHVAWCRERVLAAANNKPAQAGGPT